MKKLTLAAAIALLAVAAFAQEYLSRPPKAIEQRRIAGLRNNIQLEMSRLNDVVWIGGGPFYFEVGPTNGIILTFTNQTSTFVVGLPNPTNSFGRKIQLVTTLNSHIKLTNRTDGCYFTEPTNMVGALTITLNSNRWAWAISTGTNWFVLSN